VPNNKNVVSIIPARGGSKGLPRKNIRPVGGKPLIAWSIEASHNCPLIDRTLLSTDDEEIAAIARQWRAEVPFIRPTELAVDDASTEGVLKHAVHWLEQEDGYPVDIVVFLQPTDIFRKQAWLSQVVQALLDDPKLESCFIGHATYKNFWQVQDECFTPLSHRGYGPRQTKSVVIREDTGLACATRVECIRQGNRIGNKVRIITNEDFYSGIDIQYPFDLWLAEKVISEWGYKPNE
jgi:CMP-N,N'-diacetyllegionaminic acid synthase